MKKKLFLLALVAFVFLTGCSLKQETKDNKQKAKETVLETIDGKYVLSESYRKGTVYQGCEKALTFKADVVTLEDEYDGSTYTGTYTLKNGKLKIVFTDYKDTRETKKVEYKLEAKATSKGVKITKETKDGLIQDITEGYEKAK